MYSGHNSSKRSICFLLVRTFLLHICSWRNIPFVFLSDMKCGCRGNCLKQIYLLDIVSIFIIISRDSRYLRLKVTYGWIVRNSKQFAPPKDPTEESQTRFYQSAAGRSLLLVSTPSIPGISSWRQCQEFS